MEYINLTPHTVIVYANGADQPATHDIPTSGTIARLAEIYHTAMVDGMDIPITDVRLSKVLGLPDQRDGCAFIGSMPLLMGMKSAGIDRPDVYYPYGQVRDSQGRIIGCTSLAQLAD
jgi:hypothetical protein